MPFIEEGGRIVVDLLDPPAPAAELVPEQIGGDEREQGADEETVAAESIVVKSDGVA